MKHLNLEKLKYATRGSPQRILRVWQPFLDYFLWKCPARDTEI
jgi:hypothetical protein